MDSCAIRSGSREIIQYGTEAGRGLNKPVLFTSHVEFSLKDDVSLDYCIENLRDFASILRCRPESEVKYGWGIIYLQREPRTISFDLYWYDEQFYLKRSRAYQSRMHSELLRRYGLSTSDLHVSYSS